VLFGFTVPGTPMFSAIGQRRSRAPGAVPAEQGGREKTYRLEVDEFPAPYGFPASE
jgi:hypothetical protein